MVKTLTNVREIDGILPLLLEGCSVVNSKRSLSGIVAFLSLAVDSPVYKVVASYDGDTPTGYVLARIESNFGDIECCIVDINIDGILDSDDALEGYRVIEEWSLQNNATRMTTRTTHPKAMAKLYGFTNTGMSYIIKDIGG